MEGWGETFELSRRMVELNAMVANFPVEYREANIARLRKAESPKPVIVRDTPTYWWKAKLEETPTNKTIELTNALTSPISLGRVGMTGEDSQ